MSPQEVGNFLDKFSTGFIDRPDNTNPVPDEVTIPKYCVVSGNQNSQPMYYIYSDRVNSGTYEQGWYQNVSFWRFADGKFTFYTNTSQNPNPATVVYSSMPYGQDSFDHFVCADLMDFASTSTGGGGGVADYTPYTEFWFPVISIVAVIFICSLIYKIIIKRLMP